MTTWHEANDLPPYGIPEVEIVYWDGSYLCRCFGAYDHDAGGWYVSQEPLETDGFEVRYWAYPRLLPSEPVTAEDYRRSAASQSSSR